MNGLSIFSIRTTLQCADAFPSPSQGGDCCHQSVLEVESLQWTPLAPRLPQVYPRRGRQRWALRTTRVYGTPQGQLVWDTRFARRSERLNIQPAKIRFALRNASLVWWACEDPLPGPCLVFMFRIIVAIDRMVYWNGSTDKRSAIWPLQPFTRFMTPSKHGDHSRIVNESVMLYTAPSNPDKLSAGEY